MNRGEVPLGVTTSIPVSPAGRPEGTTTVIVVLDTTVKVVAFIDALKITSDVPRKLSPVKVNISPLRPGESFTENMSGTQLDVQATSSKVVLVELEVAIPVFGFVGANCDDIWNITKETVAVSETLTR
jgi:hypothetical protein